MTVEGYSFDIADGKMVRLVTTANKFWEGTVDGMNLHIRVGKDKGGVESGIDEISKKYSTRELARASLIEKIKDKLVKGYFSKDGLKLATTEDNLKRDPTTSSEVAGGKKSNKSFSGQYYERGNEAIKLEVNDKEVRITSIGADKSEKSEIRVFKHNDEAIEYCLKEEDWLLGEKYKTAHHKFIYTFVGDSVPVPPRPHADKSKSTTSSTHLSITAMTNDAISRSSRDRSVALSPTKSSRSADDDDDDQGDYSTYLH